MTQCPVCGALRAWFHEEREFRWHVGDCIAIAAADRPMTEVIDDLLAAADRYRARAGTSPSGME